MKHKDDRIKLINEILAGIKARILHKTSNKIVNKI